MRLVGKGSWGAGYSGMYCFRLRCWTAEMWGGAGGGSTAGAGAGDDLRRRRLRRGGASVLVGSSTGGSVTVTCGSGVGSGGSAGAE